MNLAIVAAAAVIGIVIFVVMVKVLNRVAPAATKKDAPPQPASRPNTRKTVRFPFHSTVELHWRDSEGRDRSVHAQAVDMTDKGMGVKVDSAIEKGSLVTLRGGEYNASGTAWVRHCTRRGRSFVVGLEFKDALARGEAARRHFGG